MQSIPRRTQPTAPVERGSQVWPSTDNLYSAFSEDACTIVNPAAAGSTPARGAGDVGIEGRAGGTVAGVGVDTATGAGAGAGAGVGV